MLIYVLTASGWVELFLNYKESTLYNLRFVFNIINIPNTGSWIAVTITTVARKLISECLCPFVAIKPRIPLFGIVIVQIVQYLSDFSFDFDF